MRQSTKKMQGRFDDDFDRFYAESLSGGIKIPDPSSLATEEHPNRGITTSELLDANLITLEGMRMSDLDSKASTGQLSTTQTGLDSRKTSDASMYQKNMSQTSDRRWSGSSSRSSRSRSSSGGSSNRGLPIPERVAVTREGLVEQIIEKWRATMDENQSKIISKCPFYQIDWII